MRTPRPTVCPTVCQVRGPTLHPARRPALLILLALLGTAATASGGEVTTVNQLGAQLTAERARQLRAAGMVDLATGLEQIAEQVAAGSMTVTQATALVQLTDSVAAGRRPSAANPAKPLDANGVTSVLDARPAPAAASPARPRTPPISTSVVITDTSSDGRTTVVMLDAKDKPGIAVGQRYAIRRAGKTLALVIVNQVSGDFAGCEVVPESWSKPQTNIGKDDAAVQEP